MAFASREEQEDSPMQSRPDLSGKAFQVHHDPATRVAVVTMAGTGAGNAMGGLVWSELPSLMASLEADDAIGAVVLRGAGDCFTVGLDLRWYMPRYRRLARLGEATPRFRDQLLADVTRMQDCLSALQRSRLPIVAAVHGACIGAGFDLASACDIRLAAADACFSLREARIGIVADLGVLQRLPRLIGAGPTRELALTARDLPAAEALRLRLVTRVLDSPEELFADALDVAAQIARHPAHVIAGIKEVIDQSQDMPLAAGLRYVGVWNSAFMPAPELPSMLAAAIRGSGGGPAPSGAGPSEG
jgi:enoyl-CoA hydratase